jgi:hypothetical protein
MTIDEENLRLDDLKRTKDIGLAVEMITSLVKEVVEALEEDRPKAT